MCKLYVTPVLVKDQAARKLQHVHNSNRNELLEICALNYLLANRPSYCIQNSMYAGHNGPSRTGVPTNSVIEVEPPLVGPTGSSVVTIFDTARVSQR